MQVAEPRYQQQTSLVDARYTPAADILVYVEGSSWTTNYYSQVLGADNELAPQQEDSAPAYQQYCLVKDMELKVTQALVATQDPVTSAITTNGAATTSPRFIPNKGDMFLADIGDGRVGIFTLTLTEKKSYHKDALYHIEYQLVDYADSEAGIAKVADLTSKVVKEGIYRKDFLSFGQNPVVLSKDFEYLISFNDAYDTLLTHWMRDFFSREYQTILIPDQNAPSYDPFLTKALLDFVSSDEHPYVSRIKMPRITAEQAMLQTTIWDALARMDKTLMPIAMFESKLVDTVYWRTSPYMSGVFFTGLKYVMYPLDNRTDADSDDTTVPPSDAQPLMAGKPRYTDILRSNPVVTDDTSYIGTEDSLPDIVPVTIDNYYVFSEKFYRGQAPLNSNLEKLVKDAVEQKGLDKETLLRMVNNAHKWGNLERFYYIPALLAILKVATRTN